ncbi:hypothetical protein [Streptomyces violascens]|uniref:hypothetical protein n=1 Tax=Streptomyces violascens TaxID=67381 RepID=UPI0019A677CB|nr:hypothetical protein [Streptomyces violascens]GGT85162.1 hypothetical protein GCM10010289_00940 [Streptomyces violascens]
MSEESNLMSSLWPLVPSGATDWLLELCGEGITGFMTAAMPDALWVLNAMCEHEQGPADATVRVHLPGPSSVIRVLSCEVNLPATVGRCGRSPDTPAATP